jgi:hypothetical protein
MRTELRPTATAVRKQVSDLVAVPDPKVLKKQLAGLQQDLLEGDVAGVARRLANIDTGERVWDRKLAMARYEERSRVLFERFGLQPAQLALTFGARLGELGSSSPHQPDYALREQLEGLNANGLLAELGRRLPKVSAEDFLELVAMAKERLRDPGAKNPDELFEKNLTWLATGLITDGSRYKAASSITDEDVRKLEILRKLHGFDYANELRIRFNATVVDGQKRNGVSFDKPFWIYLADGAHDLSAFQAQLIIDRVRREVPEGEAIGFFRYSGPSLPDLMMRAVHPSEHLDDKNLLHVLMERPLTPNKQRLAEFFFEKGAGNSTFKVFARDESWNAPISGRYSRSWWYDTRSVLGSAVESGSPANVRLAMERGSRLGKSEARSPNEFVEAVRRASTPAGKEIVELLMDAAVKAGTPELLNRPHRDSTGTTYPIQYFARAGDLEKVLKLAALGVGVPIEKAEIATIRIDGIPLGDTHSVNGVPLHPPTTSRTKTEYWFVEVGQESLDYVKQAVFNGQPDGSYYHAYDNVFGLALTWLKGEGVLAEKDIPGEKDPRFLNFVWALHYAASEERAKNPDFLVNAGAFTKGFGEAVGRMKEATQNFTQAPLASAA